MSTLKNVDQLDFFGNESTIGKTRAKTEPVAPKACTQCSELFLSDHEVAARFSTSRATIWRWVDRNRKFPRPIKLSPGTTHWRRSDLVLFEALVSAASVESSASKAIGRLK